MTTEQPVSAGTQCWNHWLQRHKFQPRYDLGAANTSGLESISGGGAPRLLEAMRSKTYVRDICVRCGETVERQKAGKP